ncbi:MAG: FKBP-type peptidyl-prolyl cis-trans isomerase [Panacagrimonas sp.]
MSKTFRLVAVCVCAGLLFACNKKEEAPKPVELTTDAQKFGYAIGIDLGNSLKPVSAHVDVASLKQGLDDVSSGAPLKLDDAAREAIKQSVSQKMQEEQVKQREAAASKALTEGEAFLAENAKKEGVKTTASGLQYKVLTEGAGDSPTAADEVTVHYKGTLINGEEFDSSISRGQPVTFPLGNVIEGWTEGVQLMTVGEKARFWIPADLAYGEKATRPGAPSGMLVFDIELIRIVS